jgi:signal transduction histidine kinase
VRANRGNGRNGSRAAGHQAALLFAIAGALAFAAVPLHSHRTGDLLIVGSADAVLATATWIVPWHSLPLYSTLGLAVPAFAILALSTWAFGGHASGTAPFFMLLYVWLALHHPPWSVVAVAPLTAAAYVIPLVATNQSPEVVSSAVIFVPVATTTGLVIANRVRALKDARERVAATERWRAALIDTLAHDIRSPLASVESVLRLLLEERDLTTAQRDDFTRLALRQSGRLIRLATDLLDVGRVEQGVLKLDRSEIGVRDAVTEAMEYVTGDIDVDVDPDLTVTADPQRLQQILVNLAANAVRHGRPPFVVSATRDDGHVLVAVRDHGAGVPEQQRKWLFERYSNGRSAQSVGLGLWIVRELALAHGGDVRYEEARPGARFVVDLPSTGPHR